MTTYTTTARITFAKDYYIEADGMAEAEDAAVLLIEQEVRGMGGEPKDESAEADALPSALKASNLDEPDADDDAIDTWRPSPVYQHTDVIDAHDNRTLDRLIEQGR